MELAMRPIDPDRSYRVQALGDLRFISLEEFQGELERRIPPPTTNRFGLIYISDSFTGWVRSPTCVHMDG